MGTIRDLIDQKQTISQENLRREFPDAAKTVQAYRLEYQLGGITNLLKGDDPLTKAQTVARAYEAAKLSGYQNDETDVEIFALVNFIGEPYCFQSISKRVDAILDRNRRPKNLGDGFFHGA